MLFSKPYFVDKWYANKATGIYPAFKDATFQALYYDQNANLGAAPAVVFTVGSLVGEKSSATPYWGWEEKTWNIYNGATYTTDADKTKYGFAGETLQYDPNWGYPDKIGHKYATIGNPDWSGINPMP